MNGGRLQADVVTKGIFPAQNSSDNGERVRSLLCGHEALAKPPGAAEMLQAQQDLTTLISADSHKRRPKVIGFTAKGQRLRRLRSMPEPPALTSLEISPSFTATPPFARLHACLIVVPLAPRLVLIPINGAQR